MIYPGLRNKLTPAPLGESQGFPGPGERCNISNAFEIMDKRKLKGSTLASPNHDQREPEVSDQGGQKDKITGRKQRRNLLKYSVHKIMNRISNSGQPSWRPTFTGDKYLLLLMRSASAPQALPLMSVQCCRGIASRQPYNIQSQGPHGRSLSPLTAVPQWCSTVSATSSPEIRAPILENSGSISSRECISLGLRRA